MKNIKDITLSIFAIIGFIAILSSFNTNNKSVETSLIEKGLNSGRYTTNTVVFLDDMILHYLTDTHTGAVYGFDDTSNKWQLEAPALK